MDGERRKSIWASRKWWVSVLVIVAQVVLPALGIPVPVEAVVTALTYVGAEGLADAAGAYGRGRRRE